MGEKVEVVGYLQIDAETTMRKVSETKMLEGASWLIQEPLMTVAQHERIVAGLEADARRYRWLRDNATTGSIGLPDGWLNCDEPPNEWDAAIDAFLAQTAEE